MIDQLEGVSRLSVATPGLLEPPDASGSIPPYLLMKGDPRINASSTVVYIRADRSPIRYNKEEVRL